MERLTIGTCEYRKREDGGIRLAGYAALYDTFSERIGGERFGFRERIAPGAFRRTLDEGADIRALREHDPMLILGRTKSGTLEVREDAKGLYVEIDPPDTELGRETLELVRRGDLSQMSFGFTVPKGGDEWNDNDDERTLKDVDLFDVSVVAYPAYTDTQVEIAQRSLELYRSSRKTPVDPVEVIRKRKVMYRRRLAGI